MAISQKRVKNMQVTMNFVNCTFEIIKFYHFNINIIYSSLCAGFDYSDGVTQQLKEMMKTRQPNCQKLFQMLAERIWLRSFKSSMGVGHLAEKQWLRFHTDTFTIPVLRISHHWHFKNWPSFPSEVLFQCFPAMVVDMFVWYYSLN